MEKTKTLKQQLTSIKRFTSRKVLPLLLCTMVTASIAMPSASAQTVNDPYNREDPGPGKQNITLAQPTNEWAFRTPLDYRVPSDQGGSTFEMIKYPFADFDNQSDVLKINYVDKATTTFGGLSLKSALDKTVDVPDGSNIEFDVYYPKSAQGKYMRWRLATNGQSSDTYLRDYDYTNLNPDWIGSYNGETWLKVHHSLTATTGSTSEITLELHGENARPAETGTLIVANMKITEPDPDGVPLPDEQNDKNYTEVTPLKDVYNKDNGLFMTGTLLDWGKVSAIGGSQYDLFVDGNALKAEPTHPTGPSWLTDVDGNALKGATSDTTLGQYKFPDSEYTGVRDAGNYQLHGHVMAWYNQSPTWMTQMVPATLTQGYNGTAAFYGLGNNVNGQVKVSKDMARRVQYDHIVTVMRHFLTTDEKYGSSEERGIIPFHSWDILNEEVHESRHSENIPKDENSWRDSLKNTNWLAAMSDDEITGDVTNHYVYLLFKYAHIAAPNAKMAAAYKANYASLPDYMKLDNNDDNGSIDKYITENAPKLTYNDYGIATRTKARTVYNMVKELNTAWKSDPLYDGRNLIEDIGIQGHDSINKTLASDNQYAVALYASLCDKGLLDGISYSELDLKVLPDAPGGGATAPATLNVKQADALGYEYALLYKMFRKFAPYIDHITNWGSSGEGWQGSYLLFDKNGNANEAYYAVMDPDKFLNGHTYLADYFKDENEKVDASAAIDLGSLGTYKPTKVAVKNEIKYVLNGGTNADANSTFYRTGATVKLADAAKTGYTFNGWYSDSAFKNKVTTVDTTKGGLVTVYANFISNQVSDNNVKVDLSKVTLPEGVTSVSANAVEKPSDSNTTAAVSDVISKNPTMGIQDNFKLYDLSIRDQDNNAITFDGVATVKLPVPEGMTNPHVYWFDGTNLNDMQAKVVDGELVFTTTHFSNYVVADVKKASTDTTTPGTNNGGNQGGTVDTDKNNTTTTTPTDDTTKQPTKVENPKTGDESSLPIVPVAAILAVASFAAFKLTRRAKFN